MHLIERVINSVFLAMCCSDDLPDKCWYDRALVFLEKHMDDNFEQGCICNGPPVVTEPELEIIHDEDDERFEE